MAAEEEADFIYINQMETIQKVSIKNSYGEYGFSHNGEKIFSITENYLHSYANRYILTNRKINRFFKAGCKSLPVVTVHKPTG